MINRSEKYFGAGQQANAASFPTTLSTEQEAILEAIKTSLQNTEGPSPFGYDASGRTRVAQLTTLLDGKVLGEDDTLLFETVGTGTATFGSNKVNMAVTAGQYLVRQSTRFNPYFSGKAQTVEETFENFQNETDVIKRVGYFSSNAVAPYNTNLDGVYIESDGVNSTYKLLVLNNDSAKLDLDWTLWDNYAAISGYNWANFTVTSIDFLWLGGAVLRMFLKVGNQFILAHTFNYAGTDIGTFMLSPNHPVRYEIRSVGAGVGSMQYICCQVATEGSFDESGKTKAIFNQSSITTNSTATTYALKGLRKLSTFRDIASQILECGIVNTAQNETGLVLLLRNPTLSAPLTWAPNGTVDEGTATNQTVTNNGYVVAAFPSFVRGSSNVMKENFLSFLSGKLDNTMDQYILAYKPATSNQSVHGIINFKNF